MRIMQLGKISSLFLRISDDGDVLDVVPAYICPKGTIDLGRPILSFQEGKDASRITELFRLAELPLGIDEVVDLLLSKSEDIRRDVVILEVFEPEEGPIAVQ